MDDPTLTPEPAGARKLKRRPRETRELKVKYEIVVVDGEEGRKLHQIQSQAVLEALLWLASNPKPTDDDQPDRSTIDDAPATTNSLAPALRSRPSRAR